jgi:hypothetical protein
VRLIKEVVQHCPEKLDTYLPHETPCHQNLAVNSGKSTVVVCAVIAINQTRVWNCFCRAQQSLATCHSAVSPSWQRRSINWLLGVIIICWANGTHIENSNEPYDLQLD